MICKLFLNKVDLKKVEKKTERDQSRRSNLSLMALSMAGAHKPRNAGNL